MALSVTHWIEEFKKFPPDTEVRFVGGCICFVDPKTNTVARPTRELLAALEMPTNPLLPVYEARGDWSD